MLPLSKSSKIIAIAHVISLRPSVKEDDLEKPIELPIIIRTSEIIRKTI
jgi:hypothetical protein